MIIRHRFLDENPKIGAFYILKEKVKMIAIYHRIYKRENFETAANDLIKLIHKTQEQQPGKPRALYVDIDGHRNKVGGYDEDMRELQTEFGIGFLLQFLKEVHFPLGSFKNTKKQNNDVPEELIFENAKNVQNNSLNELYIENYSNTEFMSEEDVYAYLKKVSDFLKSYDKTIWDEHKKEDFDSMGWLEIWRKHISELAIELFNSFIYGNLISVSAMTRALIECYIIATILKREKSEELIDEWWLCNMIHKTDLGDGGKEEKFEEIVKEYCKRRNINFEQKWEYYTQKAKGEKGWLKQLMKGKGVGVHALCQYINEDEIYEDYQSASAYVHGQDVMTKMSPFTFYSSIYIRLYLMMNYIFKTIMLFGVREDMEKEIEQLEYELLELGKNYIK